jgi:hypothetical protein
MQAIRTLLEGLFTRSTRRPRYIVKFPADYMNRHARRAADAIARKANKR